MKLTNWFSGEHKPAITGVYQVALSRKEKEKPRYSYWDGVAWSIRADSPSSAERLASVFSYSACQHWNWRGLKAKPSQGAQP